MIIDRPTKQQIPHLRKLWSEAFGDTEAFLDTFFSTAFSPERCRCISQENTVSAALYWFDCVFSGRKIAYIYAVATAKERQGQGLCRWLMTDTHAHLKNQGCAGAILVPGSRELFRLYEKLGYTTCGYVREISCSAGSSPVSLRRIDRNTFARLRRQMLPAGSVVQEGENLNFLETQAHFYAGDGFLLTAQKQGSSLTGLELLGDPAAAPGILRALDCEKGIFRAPGGEIPFAMYHPLAHSEMPRYFGFAFD